jgi:NADPH:quinone reductase-like Zn-dependent oxidoreductase
MKPRQETAATQVVTMRAVGFRSFGSPDVLSVLELPVPEPGAGQVRVRVQAAPVHPADLAARSGAFGSMLPGRPAYVLGWDLAGTVDALGPGVDGFAPGDLVVGMSDWLATQAGTQAEFAVLNASALAPAPAGVPMTRASTIPVNALTALQALEALGLAEGQWLAVTGAGGAVGAYAVELATQRGIRVAALGDERDEAFVTGLGAQFVARSDVPAGALRAAVPAGADALLDAAALGDAAIGAVRDGGVFVPLIPPAAPVPERDIRVAPVGVHSDPAQLRQLVALAERGRLTTRVAGTMPFGRAAEAHAAMAAGGVRGRLVLVP